MDWQRVPQAWSSSRKTPVAETVIGTSDDAHRCVVRSESARADVGIISFHRPVILLVFFHIKYRGELQRKYRQSRRNIQEYYEKFAEFPTNIYINSDL